jgi:dTDP-4-dehydrorhamnose 3,5-epimerase
MKTEGPFDLEPTELPGVFVVRPRRFVDRRGVFAKTFHRPSFAALGLADDFPEQFYSVSHRGVLRGLHFQLPPHDHTKVVTCVLGSVLDAAVDLRTDSPTYGRHILVELSADCGTLLYMPPGLAHGFYSLTDDTLMLYNHTRIHDPSCDTGIRWDSAGIAWPDAAPIVSDRDAALPSLAAFASPFRLNP